MAARRHPEPAGSLSRAQEIDLVELMRDRFPDEVGVAGALWTRPGVAALVARRHGLNLGAATVTRLLRSWGVSPGPPVERACPLCAAGVTRWTSETYPDVQEAATAAEVDVHWVGRTRLRGVSPAAEVLSAVSARGGVRFVIASTAGAPRDLGREFMVRLADGRTGAHVVVDGSWPTAEWPRRLPRQVVTHALPSCDRG